MTTESTQPVPPGGDDDALRRALEIHRRLQKEYGWDFMNTREDLAARADAAEVPAAPSPVAPGRDG